MGVDDAEPSSGSTEQGTHRRRAWRLRSSQPLTAPYFFGLPVLGQPTIPQKRMRPPFEYNARYRAPGAAVGLDLIITDLGLADSNRSN